MKRGHSLLIIVGGLIGMLIWSGCEPHSQQTSTNSMSHPDASANPVSLKVGAASYRTSDSISVILSNQGAQSISFADHQTNCTVMLVEYQVNGTWTPIKNCARKSRTVWHTLAVGEHLEVELDAPKSGWPVGLYRVTLSYRTDQNASLLTMIYSISFYVVAS